ncbi:MAG: dTDP-4-dehydrorhamnose 3,5-epimerase [Bradymonadaceae bacterium]
MKLLSTPLPGVLVIEPRVFADGRGFFVETFRTDLLSEAGLAEPFVQDNHSRSRKGVLRGLHYQLEQPQGKLVRVTRGAVYDVAVDVRLDSPSFGQWFGCVLDDETHRQLYVPPGFAHGFCVLSDEVDFVYKCTDYYHPQSEQGIAWDDPDLAIKWPLQDVSLSEKDQGHPGLADQAPERLPKYG